MKKNKVEKSPHYNEIIDLLVAGYSGRYVSSYLEDEYNEKISHAALNRYKKNKLNIKAAVKKKIIENEKEKQEKIKKSQETARANAIDREVEKEIQAQESIEIAADYRYRDVKKLDDLISEAESITVDLDISPNDEKYDPYKERSLKIKYKKLALDAMRLKYDLIDEDELTVNVEDENVVRLADSIEKSRQKYLKEIEK
ncbi:MAG: hypothetical protein IJF83_14120 [Methanobrevibacter sp.]|nr:hypothetical protein [Methanobrevibacter sp.]